MSKEGRGNPHRFTGSLCLSRKVDEKVMIGDSIVITICRIGDDQVRIGVEAPKHMLISRKELIRAIE